MSGAASLNCNEKFGRGHNRVCQRLFLSTFAEADDEDGTADTLEQSADDPTISVLAISDVRTRATMQLEVSIGGTSFCVLLDSGSSHNFITEEAVARTNLVLLPHGSMRVMVANGDRVECSGVYSETVFVMKGERFVVDFHALQLAGYDVVLGMRWLVTLGPILWDFSSLRMAFWHGDH
jgi:hypothetical protein